MDGDRSQSNATGHIRARAYAIALLASVAATLVQQSLATKVHYETSLLLALGAIALSAAYGGMYPALVSFYLTGASALYVIAKLGVSLTMSDGIALGLFAVLGLSMSAERRARPPESRREHQPGTPEAVLSAKPAAADATRLPALTAASGAGAQMMRALRAARMIAWDYDVQARLVTHVAAMEVFEIAAPRSPLSLRAALRFVYSQDRHDVLTRARAALAHREPYVQHFRIVLQRGAAPLWMENRGEILCDATGRATHLCGAMMDISAHKHALEALAAADRRKDEFIATLAHELRSPLSAIATAAQILRTITLEGTQMSACADMIRRQTDHLGRLVDDLLDMSRAIRDRLEFRCERIDLRNTVTTALETVSELVRARRHEVQVRLPPDPVEIDGDAVRLAQVFVNLLTNAAKYTPPGGRIRVALEGSAEWAAVRIADSGIGIAAEELALVFEPFYQVNASLSRARGGLGIGLALVRRIVQLHGGTVEASSAGLDCGSEFIVRLPLLQAHGQPVPATKAVDAPLGSERRRRILVADDNADVAEAMALGLRMCGHEVAVALDGDEALRIADEFQPQVALLDVDMPKRQGHEVARTLRQRRWAAEHGLFLVALTGWAPRDLQGRVDLSAFDSQMMKPTEIDAVHRLVASAPKHAPNGAT